MNIDVQTVGNFQVVSPDVATLDVKNAGVLRDLFGQMATTASTGIIVDLRHVHFMDSTGIGALFYAKNLFEKKGGSVKLVNLQDQVLTLFKVLGADMCFDLCSDVAAATAP